MRLTFGSLFSGIGGLDLGFERAGMECRWQVERNPFCRSVLAKHWPLVERHEDIHDVGRRNLAPVHVLGGGPPCQPHSDAGLRLGANDPRNLWPEMRRVVAELEPRWVVVENVPGIAGTIFGQVCADLEHLGYEVGALDIPAAAVGAPHIRQRFFILAYADGGGRTVGSDEPTSEGARLGAVANGVVQSVPGRGDGSGRVASVRVEPPANPWRDEPGIRRVVDGFPVRVDRRRRPGIHALGNAVAPPVAELIGRLIVACDGPQAIVATDEHFRSES